MCEDPGESSGGLISANGAERGVRMTRLGHSLANSAAPCYVDDGTFFESCRRLVSRHIGLKTRNRRR